MKKRFNFLLFIIFLCNISYSQNKSNVECGFFGNKTIEQRNAIFPFNEVEKVLLISYPNAEVYELSKKDSVGLSEYGYKIEKEFIFQKDSISSKVYDANKIEQLDNKALNNLSNLMFNYDYKVINDREPISLSYAKCYTPRHAILFLDKNEKLISALEICFECDKYYLFPKSDKFIDVLGLECDKRLGYFRKIFDNYGFENSQKNQKIIKFEIKDEYGILPGVSISKNDSTFVVTNFDGLANFIIDDKTERAELSYMGKPTYVKIIKNCDSIKVDISKGKAFYYNDKKFIKSKKLIVE